MDPFKRDRDKRKPENPFDSISDEDFERIFAEMQKMFENIDFKELMKNMIKKEKGFNKPFAHGFSINIGPDGKPKIQGFGKYPPKTSKTGSTTSDEHKPLVDIIEGDEDVAITVELPGVNKEDIDLSVNHGSLEINVDNPKRKYHKVVDIPCAIKPKTTKATYKNSILDVVIKRKENKKPGDDYRVSIE